MAALEARSDVSMGVGAREQRSALNVQHVALLDSSLPCHLQQTGLLSPVGAYLYSPCVRVSIEHAISLSSLARRSDVQQRQEATRWATQIDAC